ncbi:MAG: hypothetical protein ACTSUE_16145 [Promethearchaeota archaeon]
MTDIKVENGMYTCPTCHEPAKVIGLDNEVLRCSTCKKVICKSCMVVSYCPDCAKHLSKSKRNQLNVMQSGGREQGVLTTDQAISFLQKRVEANREIRKKGHMRRRKGGKTIPFTGKCKFGEKWEKGKGAISSDFIEFSSKKNSLKIDLDDVETVMLDEKGKGFIVKLEGGTQEQFRTGRPQTYVVLILKRL